MTTFPMIAKYRPLGPQTQAKMARHDVICLHTMVGYLKSTDTMFRAGGFSGVESHFGIGGVWGSDAADDLDGVIWQWQDTNYRADANLEGNHRLISIETADNAPQSAEDIKPWTPKQVDAIVVLVAALCKRYNIPARLITSSKSTERGIGYHRFGIDPWRVAGGEIWSKAKGKECPSDARIAQVPGIIKRVSAVLNPTTQEEDMPTIGEMRAMVRDELDRPETVESIVAELIKPENAKALAEALFTADVIGAPETDLAAHPENVNWRLDSYLRRLVANTEADPTPPGA